MASLSNYSPASTYPNILQLNTNGLGLQTFPQNVQDGLGNNTVMSLWTTGVNFSRAGGAQFQLDGVPLTANAAALNNIATFANSSYLLTNLDPQLPNANILLAAPGITLVPGVQTNTITPALELAGIQALLALNHTGFVSRTAGSTYSPRLLTTDGTLTITNPAGIVGDPFFQVTPDSVVERVTVQRSGIFQSTRSILNFIPGNLGTGITIFDNPGNNSADIIITSAGGGGGGGVATVIGTANQVTAVTDAFFNVTVGLPNSVIVNTSLIAGNMELVGNTLSSVNANGPIILEPSGSGAIELMNATLFQPVPLRWYNAGGTFYSAFQASNALAGNTTWTLPLGDSVGTQVLVSNGAGQLSWATNGTITSVLGTANQITVNTVGTTATVSLPNSVIITTSVRAGNLEIIGNTLEATNANGNVILSPQGTGSVQLINGTSANPVPLQWYNAAGTFFSAFMASNALAASTTWTLPTADSVGTQALVSNGAGQLSWVTGGGGITSVVGTVNQITVNTIGTVATVSLPNSVIIPTSVKAGNLEMIGNTLEATNVNGTIILQPQGTSPIQILNGTGTQPVAMQWYNAAGSFFSAFVASNALAASTTWTLPIADSVGTQALVSNGAGVLSWATTGGIPWTSVTVGAQALSPNNGYVTNHVAGVTYTLPATANLGDQIQIVAFTGIATIDQNANQNIFIGAGATTTGVAGSLTANTQNDGLTLICIFPGANTIWRATNIEGFWILA